MPAAGSTVARVHVLLAGSKKEALTWFDPSSPTCPQATIVLPSSAATTAGTGSQCARLRKWMLARVGTENDPPGSFFVWWLHIFPREPLPPPIDRWTTPLRST